MERLGIFCCCLFCFFFFFWLCWVSVLAHRIFSCGMWILVPWPRIKSLFPALRVELESLDHWGSPKRDCVKTLEELHYKEKSVNIKDYFFFTWTPEKLRNATQLSLTLVSATVSLRSVQFSPSVMSYSLWPHALQHSRPPCPSPTPKLMSIESVMPSNHRILCHPLLLLPSIIPSIRAFSNESAPCIRWAKYWRFSFYISPWN